jgi:hypothetical protein
MKNRVIESFLQTEDRTAADGLVPSSSLLDRITEGRSATQAIPAGGVIVGKFVGFDSTGSPLVSFVAEISHEEVIARSMIFLREIQIGSDVVLAFERGDLAKPIVMGSLWQPEKSPAQERTVAELDGERITLTAEKEIVLRCGKASITLTQAGKVLIRGAYLSSHSSGVNRIKGGSVQIN